MSSDVQSDLQHVVLDNYLSLAAITAVVYDYILTFSREVEYVWCRPWTWVSTMFVIVRYIGLYWIMTAALTGTSFVPGPVEVGKIMFLSYIWGFVAFLSAADLLMILRVYAMWNRSMSILRVLLLVYTIQTLITVVFEGIYNNPNTHLSAVRILEFSICCSSTDNTSHAGYYVAPRLVLSALLAILAIFQTVKQSFEMYKATKQWQPNRYMQKLAKEGILYFLVNVLFQLGDLLHMTGFPAGTSYIVLKPLICIAFYIPISRFVINIRELYDRDVHRCFHIDTGFGVVSRLNAGQDTTVSALVFMDGNQGAEVEGGTHRSGDLGMGRVHRSRLHEDSPSEPGSSRV
ncbi:hypothetical protein L210DRAFT_3755861 [Boletus edulis BED1]|uniref:DUF6533 domain-containing protein n=1 Tax=Boletus edulis BED1 TaxID=1328754 RepID=A0AAD4CAW3_BOLED|nr:hypothetical protein L210DRAFT_3755861 [Boletus edulis BED1]